MNKRVFLVLLVFFLLLAAMSNQHVQNGAALLGNGQVLGFIPLWKLYNVLPAGIFAAGVCTAALGMGAEFWRALLTLCGATWAPRNTLDRLADAGLWCGWVTLAACIGALGCIYHPLSVGTPTADNPSFYDLEHYRLVLLIGAGVMLLCRLLSRSRGAWLTLHITILTAATALVCGQYWCRTASISFFGTVLLLPWAVLMCHPGKLSRQQYYMSLATIAMALYGLSFAPTIINYVTDVDPLIGNYSLRQSAINALLPLAALLAALILRPLGLRHKAWMQWCLGLLMLLCCLSPIWYFVVAGAVGTLLDEHLSLAVGCFLVPLFCVSGLFLLRLRVTAPTKKQEN